MSAPREGLPMHTRSKRCSCSQGAAAQGEPSLIHPQEGSSSHQGAAAQRLGGLGPAPQGGTQPLEQPDLGTYRARDISSARHLPEHEGLSITEPGMGGGGGGQGRTGALGGSAGGGGPRALPGCHRGDLSGGVEDVAGGDGEGGQGLGEVVNREEHWKGQETRG